MPLPSKKNGEERKAFISRCMSELTNKKEGKDTKQRVAMCYSQWKKTQSFRIIREIFGED